MEFEIRKAGIGDIDGIMKLMQEAVQNTEHPEWFVSDDEAYVREHLEEKGYVITACTPEGELQDFSS